MSTRRLLARNRDFRRLFLASVVSLGGDWFSFVAVADLVTELTGRPGTAAYVYAATVLPVFLASPIAGKLADRYDRRMIMVIADLARVPVALSLCLASYYGSLPLAVIAITLLGVGASFYDPIAAAATPNVVDADDLATAQSLMGALWGSMLLVGAGLGGLVAEVFGRYAAFSVDAASFLVSAWLLTGIRRPLQEDRSTRGVVGPGDEDRRVVGPPGDEDRRVVGPPGDEDRRVVGPPGDEDRRVVGPPGDEDRRVVGPEDRGRLRDVWTYAKQNQVVGRLLFAKGGVSWANGIVGLLPAFAHGKFGGVPIATGLLFAARGLGALLGPLIARAVSGSTPSPRAIVVLCAVSTLGYGAFYAVFPLVTWFPLALVLVTLAHLGGGAQWAVSTFGLQVATPDHLRGRVMSLDYGLATLGIGVSAIAAGAIADAANEALSTWCLAVVAGIYGIVWWIWSWRVVKGR